jgi:hypothetical protein
MEPNLLENLLESQGPHKNFMPPVDRSHLSRCRTFTIGQKAQDQLPHSLECTESRPLWPALQPIDDIND